MIVFEAIKKFFITVAVILMCLPKVMLPVQPKTDENADFNAVIISDVHTDGDPFRDRNNFLRKAFTGITQYCGKTDALIMPGDITNCGDKTEYSILKNMLKAYVQTESIVPQMGNHDSWNHSDDPDFDTASRLFRDFCSFCDIETDRNYFTKDVDGYTFIALGTEEFSHDSAHISDEQLAWFDNALGEASQNGKPVFVLCHQPPDGINGASNIWYESSADISTAIENTMIKYSLEGTKIAFFSGHIHTLGDKNFELVNDNLCCVNLPCFLTDGIGFTMQVYADRIAFQGVDFISGEALENYYFEF